MAKPIAFGAYQFRTKKNATDEARRRINQYETGERLKIDDELFFSSLFTLHSEFGEKKGVGIDYITVQRDFNNNRCLYIHRVDGTKVDCSWVHCIRPASQKTLVSMAFRRAIKEIIIAYKKSLLDKTDLVCPLLGIKLTFDNSHVAYLNLSFDAMFNKFLNEQKLDIKSIELINPEPNDKDQRGQIADLNLAEKWRSYHQDNATLQLLSAKANLQR